jgi:predicted HicB family RNase H-like nuclease
MKNTMTYKGHAARIEYSDEDSCDQGRTKPNALALAGCRAHSL